MLLEKLLAKRGCKLLLLFPLLLSFPGMALPLKDKGPGGNPQENYRGLPIIQNFNPREYLHLTAHSEHFSIIQNNQGIMLIGSHGGVLVYSGSSWQFVEVPGKSMVWSLGSDPASGRVYVGASDNLGYLAVDASGRTSFNSLLSHLPQNENIGSLGNVWTTLVTPEGIYFKTNQYLLRWHQNQFKVWKADKAFGALNWIEGKLYLHQAGKGLFVLQNDQLELYSNDKAFSAERPLFLLPLNDKKWFVSTYEGGLYYFDGIKTSPVNSEVGSFLLDHSLFSGTLLPDGNIALGTLKGGVVIIDQDARVKRVINKESGLVTNTVYLVSPDQQGGLWLSSEKGLSRVRINTPFSYFNEQNGLKRQTYAMSEHQGQLFAGTTDGLFLLEEKAPLGATATFQKKSDSIPGIWSLHSVGESLLIASEGGLFEWRKGEVTSLNVADTPWESFCNDIQPDQYDSSLIYVASLGVYAFRKEEEQWINCGKVPGLQENVSQLLQTPSGDLWLPVPDGLARIRFPRSMEAGREKEYLKHAQLNRYGKEQGIPEGVSRLYWVGKQLIAQIGEVNPHLYRFREDFNTFEFIPEFGGQFGLSGHWVHPALEYSNEQQIWLWVKQKEGKRWKLALAGKEENETYAVKNFDFGDITEAFRYFAYLQENKVLWYSGVNGLVRFDQSEAKPEKYLFPTVLERMVITSDSIMYPAGSNAAVLPFQHNTIRFELSAPSYNGSDENQFQYWLEGYEENWSGWSSERYKEFTRIPEGTYTLHARALNAQGELGVPLAYTFEVLPPWYRSIYMYVLYVLMAGGGFWLLVHWRSAKLEAEKEVLENIVSQRTREVAQKNQQLSEQASELALQTEKLKELDVVKSNFFANISHEFRTPLSLIINNLVDKLSISEHNPEQTHVPVTVSDLQVMSRNGSRLLQLINQLLDLSKIESGKLQLEPQPGDMKQLFTIVFASFSSLASSRQINFQLQLPEEPLLCHYDEDKLEKILYNLLSNAFKFCPQEGSVLLDVGMLQTASPPRASMIQIRVQDSGPGLPVDQLEHIFDRFYRGRQYYEDSQGTGIGLALTKELVELHQGLIWAESVEGAGATFVVQIPFVPADQEVQPENPQRSASYVASKLLNLPHQPDVPEQHVSIVAAAVSEEQPLILVVEDNEDLRDYIKRHLEYKYRVQECENGKLGLARAQELMPDLIISDWMMPELDGLEMSGQLKSDFRTSHIPLIMLTALATADARLTGLQRGVDDYLTKPFNSQELLIRIHNLLENRRKLRDHFSRIVRLEPSQMVVASADEKFLQRIMQIVEERMGDSEFSVEEFSREAGLSRVHLHRKLKALTGQAPGDFVRMIRLKQAAQLLEARVGNIAEVAYQVGFNNLSYFSKCFREEYGVPPNEYLSSKKPAPF